MNCLRIKILIEKVFFLKKLLLNDGDIIHLVYRVDEPEKSICYLNNLK